MRKKHIYLMPGMAAGPEIFERLDFSSEAYELHYLKWKKPLSIRESLSNYAMRILEDIQHEKPVLVGVSFGGIIVQEMSKFIELEKLIIISSVKKTSELPRRFNFARESKIYKLFPTKIVSNFELFSKFFVGKTLEKKAKIYKKYLSVRDELYLKWSIHNILNWQQEQSLEGVLHIHGSEDQVFPAKYITNAIILENGTHEIILTKAKEISKIIRKSLTS